MVGRAVEAAHRAPGVDCVLARRPFHEQEHQDGRYVARCWALVHGLERKPGPHAWQGQFFGVRACADHRYDVRSLRRTDRGHARDVPPFGAFVSHTLYVHTLASGRGARGWFPTTNPVRRALRDSGLKLRSRSTPASSASGRARLELLFLLLLLLFLDR